MIFKQCSVSKENNLFFLGGDPPPKLELWFTVYETSALICPVVLFLAEMPSNGISDELHSEQ